MRTSRDLIRYLEIGTRSPRQPARTGGRRGAAKRLHVHVPVQRDVEINGHFVSVTEDDVGVVELHEE